MHLPTHVTFFRTCTSLVSFLVPALVLWLPSGYAYGTGLLVLCALAAIPWWIRRPAAMRGSAWLALAIGLMGCVWLLGTDATKGLSILNKPLRYFLAIPCLFYALTFPPRAGTWLAGIAVGAAAGGLRALYDVQVIGIERAWGYPDSVHNSIQYGDLSGLMGLMCWVLLVVFHGRRSRIELVGLGICGALGMLGLLLSQTRGGWLAIALCASTITWVIARQLSKRLAVGFMALLCALSIVLAGYKAPEVTKRLVDARSEIRTYQQSGDANTSVGQRLDHWRLAVRMGLEKPIAGWGDAGYQAEKQRQVQAGQAHPFVLQFGHAHNEWLDMFSKRGLLGVGGLLLFYAIPLLLFWPRGPLPGRSGTRQGMVEDLALRTMGVLLPLSYFGFGLTQVFLAHYNGNMFYLAMCILAFSLLHGARSADHD